MATPLNLSANYRNRLDTLRAIPMHPAVSYRLRIFLACPILIGAVTLAVALVDFLILNPWLPRGAFWAGSAFIGALVLMGTVVGVVNVLRGR